MRLRRALAIAVGLAGLVLGVVVLALMPGAPDDRLPAEVTGAAGRTMGGL